MAVTVDYSTQPYTIEFKQADCTLVSGTRYQITVDEIWQLLRDYSDGSEGMAYPVTYRRIPATASTPAITEINDPLYQAQFENGAYSVDIINGNTNFRDVEVKTQVSVGTNNTTGFVDPTFLQQSVFGNVVAVNTSSIYSGTDFPVGTKQQPVNNMADALVIANIRGLREFLVDGSLTLTSNDYSDGYIFKGESPLSTVLTIDTGANVTNCEFRNFTIQGTLDSGNLVRECNVLNLTHINGFIYLCALNGDITLGGTSADTALIMSCYSGFAGTGAGQHADIYCGGATGANLAVRDFQGGLAIHDCTRAIEASIDMSSGRVTIENDVTNGSFTLRGIGDLEDNSTGTTVNDQLLDPVKLDELHKLQGLDSASPMTVTPTSRVAGGISQVISGDGLTTSTVTRS